MGQVQHRGATTHYSQYTFTDSLPRQQRDSPSMLLWQSIAVLQLL